MGVCCMEGPSDNMVGSCGIFFSKNSAWCPASPAEVGTDGVTRTKSLLEAEFGSLSGMPPFPFEEVAKAFQMEEKRLRSM